MDVRVWSDRHWSFWRCGAGSVGVLRLEWRRICGSCRFAPRSWSASVYSSKTYDYLGFSVLMSPHHWSRNGWSSWLCFNMYSTAKSALLCHLSHLHLSCTSAEKVFLGHESCFVHLWRNQVVDHFKLKHRDGVFGWKFIKDFPSSHIHKWKRFGPGLFWCITVFFF